MPLTLVSTKCSTHIKSPSFQSSTFRIRCSLANNMYFWPTKKKLAIFKKKKTPHLKACFSPSHVVMYFKHLTKKRPKWFCPRPLVAPQKVSSSFSHLGVRGFAPEIDGWKMWPFPLGFRPSFKCVCWNCFREGKLGIFNITWNLGI